jgi:succinate dehydrogenase / fumarate reductase flavoprotein subunit
MSKLDSKIPEGSLEQKWSKYRSTVALVNPANKRSLEIIVVGSGLAGASAASFIS